MRARRLDDGRIEIPTTDVDENGDLTHGVAVLDPGDFGYDEFDRWLRQEEGPNCD